MNFEDIKNIFYLIIDAIHEREMKMNNYYCVN
jgi:hypothetical protein